MKIILYSPKITSRLEYLAEVLFGKLLLADYQLTADLDMYRRSPLPRVNYSRQRQSGEEIFLPASGLLLETGIRPQWTELISSQGLPAFFGLDYPEADFPFDLPAMVFYLITRYEEYLPHRKDRYGRFPASESLAFQQGFLHQPLIDQWAQHLRQLMIRKYPKLELPRRAYSFVPTFDIDLAWAFRYRPWWRQLGAFLKEALQGNLAGFKQRWQVLREKAPDPFDTFEYLKQLHEKHGLQPVFFFLLGDYHRYDRNVSHRQPALQTLIKNIAAGFPVGIHPSFRSNRQPRQLKKEIYRLQYISGKEVNRSRQHFLKLELPFTYRRLIEAGITDDFTMGYADQTGFRAGTSAPFPWYDLEKEHRTGLTVHPFQVMDVTLKKYLKLSPEKALVRLMPMIEAIRETGGAFCSLWHNSSFSALDGWEEWREMYEQLVEKAGAPKKEASENGGAK